MFGSSISRQHLITRRSVLTFRRIFAVVLAAIAAISYLWFYPLGTRSAQSDLKGGDARVIALSRPHYIIPREYQREGGMNPIDFWSHAADPNFGANKISVFEFVDLDGETRMAAVQGFNINRAFTNPAHRDDVMAIRVVTEIFEFGTPDFRYVGTGANLKYHFLGQNDGNLYFYTPYAYPKLSFVPESGKHVEGIVEVSLPFGAGKTRITTSDDVDNWALIVASVTSIELGPNVHSDLCNGKKKGSREFAQTLFGREC